MTREEKKQARIERYEELARKAEMRSHAAYERSSSAVENIPFGQPILVGHHSEKRHRAALERSDNAMRASVQESDKADYYRSKAEAAENNNAIYSDDENAVEKLEEKIARLEAMQQAMKDRNKIFKSKKLSAEEKIVKLVEMGMTEDDARSKLAGDFCGRIGYASYELTNNGATIRTAKQRLERVKALQGMEEKVYEVNGVKVRENPAENRFQIFFNGKPSEEVRKKLKGAGYRWAPSEGCWQCYFKRWYINAGKEILESL